MALHQGVLPDRGDDPLVDGGVEFIAPAHVAHHDDELIAAQAAHRIVRAHRLCEPPRHGAQQAITNVVAQGVVDELKSVQVKKQHAHLFAGLAGLRQRLGQALVAHGAVGQFGQHIVVGQKADALLFDFAVGNVNRNTDVVHHFTADRALAHGRHHEPRGVGVARLFLHMHLALPRLIGLQTRPQGLLCVIDQKAQVLADGFVKVVTGAAAKRAVDADDPARLIHDDDALARGFKHLGPQLQALLHDLELVDGGERSQHRVTPLVLQAAG